MWVGMRQFLEPPETECPRCGRPLDATLPSRTSWFFHQIIRSFAHGLIDLRCRCRTCRMFVHVPVTLPRTVVGYHGCDRTFAERLVSRQLTIRDWLASEREFEWLGKGVYFWEHAPGRAWQWAEEHHPGNEAVLAIEVRLGRCLDLADTVFTPLLLAAYNDIKEAYEAEGKPLPKNTGGKDKKARRLDCLVLNHLMAILEPGMGYQTIRCPFEEGDAAFPGGNIRIQSHVQIAVRDLACLVPPVRVISREGDL